MKYLKFQIKKYILTSEDKIFHLIRIAASIRKMKKKSLKQIEYWEKINLRLSSQVSKKWLIMILF